ncbi:MAG: hypothetical protein KIT73_10010 [Burkholderiales bacterium]|nr:hypothetical protein [Burkholderiales bacterium]
MDVTELSAKVELLQAGLEAANKMNMEAFYWWCTALMIAIHAGFLAYEMGASRAKNALASGIKNALAFAFMVPTFYFIGWWIYLAFPGGFSIAEGSEAGLAWSLNMGPNLTDSASGVFWAAFALFAATTASIMSGSVIERMRISAFVILAIFLGSFVWILGASWGWNPAGWLTTKWGLHDIGAAGCVHMISGFFTLGVLINLGPRIGRFNPDGTANDLSGHNMPMSLIGLMLIVMGFFGFLGGCIIYTPDGWTTIYNTPVNLSAFAFNALMGVAGGMIGTYIATRDPFWMMSGALVGVISAASGLDVYYPAFAFVISFVGGLIIPRIHDVLVKLKIDDPVGAVSVHGFGGVWGVLSMGIFAAGYPNVEGPATSFGGQFMSMLVFAALGFFPGFISSYVLKSVRLLRVPHAAELAGLDICEIPIKAYPESHVPPSVHKTPPVAGTPPMGSGATART